MHSSGRSIALALLLLCGSAQAVQQISIAPVAGDTGRRVEKQLSKALCRRLRCVPWAKVSNRKHAPDFERAAQAGVDGLLVGRVRGGKLTLTLTAIASPDPRSFSTKVILTKEKVSAADLTSLATRITRRLAGGPSPSEPSSPSEPPPATSTPVIAPEPPPVQQTAEASAAETARSEPAAERTEHPSTWPVLRIEAGSAAMQRSLLYTGVTRGVPLNYSLPFTPAPYLSAELYPLAHSEGALHRLGVAAGGTLTFGLKTQGGTSVQSYATSLGQGDAGILGWFGGGSFALAPGVGYRYQRFSTQAAADGSRLVGLPDTTYSAVRFSLSLLGVLATWLQLEARGSVMPVFAAADLVSPSYFAQAKALAFEGEGGFRLLFGEHLGISAFVTYVRYDFNFSGGGFYQASSAVDSYLGGRLSAVLTF